MDDHAAAAERFRQLDPRLKEMLSGLKTEEVETLEYLATIPKTEAKAMMKMFRDVRAISRFMQWLILTIVALFIGTVVLYENILKAVSFLKGNSS